MRVDNLEVARAELEERQQHSVAIFNSRTRRGLPSWGNMLS